MRNHFLRAKVFKSSCKARFLTSEIASDDFVVVLQERHSERTGENPVNSLGRQDVRRSVQRMVVADLTSLQMTIRQTRVPTKQTSGPCATTDK